MHDTVLLFTSLREPLEAMTDDQAGQLFKAILAYQSGEEVILDGLLNVIFLQIKQQIDYNNEKYSETSEKRSEAGKKGMSSRWSKKEKDNKVITNDNKNNNVMSVITNDNIPITSDNKNNLYDNDNDNENDIKKESREKRKRFVPPTLEEVTAYCKERGNSVDPKKFFDYYEEGKWKDSRGEPVKNWKQKLITWENKGSPSRSAPKFNDHPQSDTDLADLEKRIFAN